MSARAATIVNVGYRSTNFYVVSAGRSRLLVDLGWPGTFDTLRANLARKRERMCRFRRFDTDWPRITTWIMPGWRKS